MVTQSHIHPLSWHCLILGTINDAQHIDIFDWVIILFFFVCLLPTPPSSTGHFLFSFFLFFFIRLSCCCCLLLFFIWLDSNRITDEYPVTRNKKNVKKREKRNIRTCCVVSCCLVRETKVALAGIPGDDVGASTWPPPASPPLLLAYVVCPYVPVGSPPNLLNRYKTKRIMK